MTDPKAAIIAQARRLLLAKKASRSFRDFIEFRHPEWDKPPFHITLINTLDLFITDRLLNDAGQPIHNLLITMPPRHAIHNDTPILTTNGWTTHGGLKPGDYVFHPSGTPTKVTHVHPKTPMTHKIAFTDGEEIICNEEHQWPVYNKSSGERRILSTRQLLDIKFGKGKVAFRSITEASGQGNCITVESPDGLYLVGRTLKPTHNSKSTYSTIELPSYQIGRDPAHYIMTTSYNAELATDFGREVRNIVASPEYQLAYPNVVLARDSQSAATWRTNAGGAYFGMGLGGSTSGRPANLLTVDDPYKNREDAESPSTRRRVWNYYQSALVNRLQPTHDSKHPKQIIIHTRWHPDDLIGQIQRLDEYSSGSWHHIEFKAITLDEHGEEQALWPERFPLEMLHRMRRLNAREFEALYQQSPYIQGGNLIRGEWWQYFPLELKPKSWATLIIATDTAFKEKEHNDYSVAILMGLTNEGDIFVLDIMRDRYNFPALKQALIGLNSRYRGQGLRGLYIEDAASGQSLIQELRVSSGIAVIPYRSQGDKVSRVNAITPLIQGGRVFLPEQAPWLDDFLKEAEQFPNGSFDDQVDAFTMGLDILSKTAISPDSSFGSAQGQSLLQEYNTQRALILGHTPHKGSLNSQRRTNFKWRGWGI